MYTTYAIKSENRKYIYIGITNNVERRMHEHNLGYNKTTAPYRPFVLIYSKKFESRARARELEKRLKTGSGREFLKEI